MCIYILTHSVCRASITGEQVLQPRLHYLIFHSPVCKLAAAHGKAHCWLRLAVCIAATSPHLPLCGGFENSLEIKPFISQICTIGASWSRIHPECISHLHWHLQMGKLLLICDCRDVTCYFKNRERAVSKYGQPLPGTSKLEYLIK